MLTRDCTAPGRQNWVFVTPDNSRTSLLQPPRVIRWGADECYPISERWNGRPCLAAQHSGTGFVTEGPCFRNAACRGSTVPRAEAQPWRSSSRPRLLLCQTRNLSHCCPPSPSPPRLNSTSQLGGGSFFPPASFDCQTRLFGKLLRSYFFFFVFNTTAKILWSHIIARTYLLWHELKSFLHSSYSQGDSLVTD